jgi:hypothetical protein
MGICTVAPSGSFAMMTVMLPAVTQATIREPVTNGRSFALAVTTCACRLAETGSQLVAKKDRLRSLAFYFTAPVTQSRQREPFQKIARVSVVSM